MSNKPTLEVSDLEVQAGYRRFRAGMEWAICHIWNNTGLTADERSIAANHVRDSIPTLEEYKVKNHA